MEYRRFDQVCIVRLDPGEDILEEVRAVSLAEGIRLASVQGLGAVDDFTVGVFDPVEKTYQANQFQGRYQIVSLTGTVNTMDGGFYCHLHMSAAGEDGQVVGGHLNRAEISATCEMILRLIDGTVDRKKDPETGLNLFRFD